MSMRLLTKRFTSFSIAKCERKFKKDFMDFIDIGNLSISKMLMLIEMGNPDITEEAAAERLDNYLMDENNGLIDAYIQLLDELNRDTKILKGTDITIESLKQSIYKKMEKSTDVNTVEDGVSAEAGNTALQDNEDAKVGVDGFITLD